MSETNANLSEEEIDKLVIEQADNEDAWEEPVYVKKEKPSNLTAFLF
jgi:hypothetical protein